MLRIVQTENGSVRGLPAADPRITSFKGIPFAAPPVGKNRWKAPQPAKDWDGVFQASEFGPISMQATPGVDKENIYSREWHVDPQIPMDEDCLYLNVWTPASSEKEKLPVFVWYFGGGLQVGYPSEMEFDGERIARRGVVVVTINYRLNVFGFLCHPDITKENPKAPANFGHLDQQFATRWVQRNIAAFGGDPNQITIGGQSAGAGSVISQLTSPQNQGLCQAAIIQSGMFAPLYPRNFGPRPGRDLESAEQEGVKFFQLLGVTSLAEARELDADYILKKSLEYRNFWGTVIDNEFCVGNNFELFLENRRLEVPILTGHTSNEFFSTPNVKTKAEFEKLAIDMFGDKAKDFLELCGFESESLEEMLKRATINGIEYAIRAVGAENSKNNVKTPMYYYNFDAEIPGWDDPGTFHSVDLWFFFETLAKCWRPFVGKHYDLARQMCNYWANFISKGDPNGKDINGLDMPCWEPYSQEKPFGMVFGERPVFVKQQPDPLMVFLVDNYKNKTLET